MDYGIQHGVPCIASFFLTSLWYDNSPAAHKAKIDELFTRMVTPVDSVAEGAQNVDHAINSLWRALPDVRDIHPAADPDPEQPYWPSLIRILRRRHRCRGACPPSRILDQHLAGLAFHGLVAFGNALERV